MAGVNNRREERVKEQAEELGWNVLGAGWPDFLMTKTGCIVCIEVKPAKGRGYQVTPIQRRVHAILRQAGITVEVIRVGGKCNKKKVRRDLQNIFTV